MYNYSSLPIGTPYLSDTVHQIPTVLKGCPINIFFSKFYAAALNNMQTKKKKKIIQTDICTHRRPSAAAAGASRSPVYIWLVTTASNQGLQWLLDILLTPLLTSYSLSKR